MQTTIITNFRKFGLIGFNIWAARNAAYKLLLDGEHLEVAAFHVESEEVARRMFSDKSSTEEFVDNFRFAYADDAAAMAEYESAEQSGCCGSLDMAFMVGDRLLHIGCNYGH